MKKLLIVIFSALLLVACSNLNENKSADEQDNTIKKDEESGIEVNKGLLNVEITLPEYFFEEDELAEIEAEMEETHHANVTQNGDGSITVKMSKNEHKQLMGKMQEEFILTINDIIADEAYESINDVTYNRDFSEIQIYVDRQEFENSLDGLALFSLGFTSLFYQVFDGKNLEEDKVVLTVIDAATNDEIESIIYPDVFEEIDPLLEED